MQGATERNSPREQDSEVFNAFIRLERELCTVYICIELKGYLRDYYFYFSSMFRCQCVHYCVWGYFAFKLKSQWGQVYLSLALCLCSWP